MANIKNPILRGFNPDPSICRSGDDYYIATSTFEWYPGVQLSHFTADTIDGPWSDPVYLNSSGFDPSLFHDEDGRKWFVNMLWNHNAYNRFPGFQLHNRTNATMTDKADNKNGADGR